MNIVKIGEHNWIFLEKNNFFLLLCGLIVMNLQSIISWLLFPSALQIVHYLHSKHDSK